MKKVFLYVVTVSFGFSVLFSWTVNAADVVTDAQINSIRTHCTEIQGSLTRLKQSDTLLRINRGQLYQQAILRKLMTPLNQRITTSQLDGSALVRITAEYDRAYKQFFALYREYETSLVGTQSIDCSKQPATFYDSLAKARLARTALHAANSDLVRLALEYQQSFKDFKKALLEQQQEVGSS